MSRGRSNSVVAPTLPIGPGNLANCIYLRALLRFLYIVAKVVLFVYLVIFTSNPGLDDHPGDPLDVARQGGLGRQRGQRRALVEAAPPVAHDDVEHHGGTQVMDEVRRLARRALIPGLVALISVSIMPIVGRVPMGEVVRALAGLSSVVIQAGFLEAETSAASCLDPGHSGTEGFTLQCSS